MIREVFILRGLPGAGKSTWRLRFIGAEVVSADAYFEGPMGYRFRASELGDAHAVCLRSFVDALRHDLSPVIVDNTNIEAWEIAPYYQLGLAYGYEPVIVHFDVSVSLAADRNKHGVPLAAIRSMERRMQRPLPPHWKVIAP